MMIQANNDARPSRPNTASLSLQQAPPIDVLSQEVEEISIFTVLSFLNCKATLCQRRTEDEESVDR